MTIANISMWLFILGAITGLLIFASGSLLFHPAPLVLAAVIVGVVNAQT